METKKQNNDKLTNEQSARLTPSKLPHKDWFAIDGNWLLQQAEKATKRHVEDSGDWQAIQAYIFARNELRRYATNLEGRAS